MLLLRDGTYRYGRQITKWLTDLTAMRQFLEPFRVPGTDCVVRVDKTGRYAIFVREDCSMRRRYYLEKKLGCRVVDPDVYLKLMRV